MSFTFKKMEFFNKALIILWISMILSFIKLLINLSVFDGNMFFAFKTATQIVSILIFIANVIVLVCIEKKLEWARDIFLLLTVLGVLPIVLDGITFPDKNPSSALLYLAQIIFRTYGLWLLYKSPADEVFIPENDPSSPLSHNTNYD